MSTNIRSLTKIIDQLRNLVTEISPDFISLVEVFNPLSKYVRIPKYHEPIIRTRQRMKLGGGTCLYIRDCYTFETLDIINYLELNIIEVLAVRVTLNDKKITIITLYRPPNAKVEESFRDLDKILDKIDDQRVIICGDFNIDLYKDNSIKTRYLDKILSHNLYQLVSAPTRVARSSATLLDHILTSMNAVKVIVTNKSISDHQIIMSMWDYQVGKDCPKNIGMVSPNMNKIHYAKTLDNLHNTDWTG